MSIFDSQLASYKDKIRALEIDLALVTMERDRQRVVIHNFKNTLSNNCEFDVEGLNVFLIQRVVESGVVYTEFRYARQKGDGYAEYKELIVTTDEQHDAFIKRWRTKQNPMGDRL